MGDREDARHAVRHPLAAFYLLAVALSVPFWVVGFTGRLPGVALPASALQTVVPAVVAFILVRRERGPAGAKRLAGRSLDPRTISPAGWILPALLLPPAAMTLEYAWMRADGIPLPPPGFFAGRAFLLFAAFLVGAFGEEVGWLGYVFERMDARRAALSNALIIGIVWAAWHVIGYFQIHPGDPRWVGWQCAQTVAVRVLLVWIYQNAGKSVAAAILLHAAANTGAFLFPVGGSFYDPFRTFVILGGFAAVAAALWGPRTLARFPFGRGTAPGARPPE